MALVCKNNLQWTGLLVTRLPRFLFTRLLFQTND